MRTKLHGDTVEIIGPIELRTGACDGIVVAPMPPSSGIWIGAGAERIEIEGVLIAPGASRGIHAGSP